MTLFLDGGTVLWKAAFAQQNGSDPWQRLDDWIESGNVLCLDSKTNIRKVFAPYYKANRKTLTPDTKKLMYAAVALSKESQRRYLSWSFL